MKTLNLRNVPDNLHKAIKILADTNNITIERLVIVALRGVILGLTIGEKESCAKAELVAMAPELYGLAKSIVWAENDDDIRLAKRLAKEIIAKIEENA